MSDVYHNNYLMQCLKVIYADRNRSLIHQLQLSPWYNTQEGKPGQRCQHGGHEDFSSSSSVTMSPFRKTCNPRKFASFLLSVRKACCGDSGVRDDAVFRHGPCSCVRFVTRRSRYARLRYSVLVWHKHGLLTIASI